MSNRMQPVWRLVALTAAMVLALTGEVETAERLDPIFRARVIADIDAAIRKDFAHWQGVPALDYHREAAAWRRAAEAAADRLVFSRRTEAFVASLQNGHTRFSDTALYRNDPGNLGLGLRHLNGQWVVVRSLRPDIPTGSVIRRIDSTPFEAFYGRVKAQISASSDRTRRSLLSFDASLFPARFTLTLGSNRVVKVDRRLVLQPSATETPMVEGRWLSPQVAYLRLGRFNRPEYQAEARRLVAGPYAGARAMVIDLRGNGGGNTPSALGRDLLGPDWRFWRIIPPGQPVAPFARPEPASPRFVLIVDRGCGSACEDFAMPFSISEKAVLVGETTGGSSGQPRTTDWGNGMSLQVGSRRQWFPDGREFEGVGVSPDVAIEVTAADFAPGSPDRMLLCARELAEGVDRGACRRSAEFRPPP